MIEKSQNRHFFVYKRPQYHFFMVFMMVFIDFLGLRKCRMSLYWSKPTNWRQLTSNLVKNDRKITKWSFLPTNDHNTTFSWFLLWFLSIFRVSDCVGWVFLVPNLLIDVIWLQIMCKMIEKWQNQQFFYVQMTTIPLFHGFHYSFYWFFGSLIV